MSQKPDELAIDYFRRIASWIDFERESILQDLPTVEAVIEYFGLWGVYGTDLMEGILECIAEGDSPEPLQRFIDKYKLNWEIPIQSA